MRFFEQKHSKDPMLKFDKFAKQEVCDRLTMESPLDKYQNACLKNLKKQRAVETKKQKQRAEQKKRGNPTFTNLTKGQKQRWINDWRRTLKSNPEIIDQMSCKDWVNQKLKEAKSNK